MQENVVFYTSGHPQTGGGPDLQGPEYRCVEGRMLRCLLLLILSACTLSAADRPNVLWITYEDSGPQLGCYGDAWATTPELDRLAARSLRYRRAWSVAPVCAPARTALITGMYPSSSGAIHMRSEVRLPEDVQLFPQYLRAAGIYCTNNVKEDYNVTARGKVWDASSQKAHWRQRAQGQPFFAVFNFTDSHESQTRKRPHTFIHDPAKAPLPPYWPDVPAAREAWAQYYDQVSVVDRKAGSLLRDLAADGLDQDTIVFCFGDHGAGLPRHKRTPCDSGLHVAFIAHFPDKWKHLAPAGYAPGSLSERLISFVDLAPTMLSIMDLPIPPHMQGRAFAGKSAAAAPEYLYGQRGRMDERMDIVRSATDGRYSYVRNFLTNKAAGERNAYMFETELTRVWFRMFQEGGLNPVQRAFWEPHPAEELYDLTADPHEVKNLAADPAHQATVGKFRAALRQHCVAVRDVALLPEPEMLRRAAGGPPLDFARRADFDPERLYQIADQASSGNAADLPALAAGLNSPDAGIRWWSVMGHLMRGGDVVKSATAALRPLLADSNTTVRLAAAECLARHDTGDAAPVALQTLLAGADLRKNDFHDSLQALGALDTVKECLEAQMAAIKALPGTSPAQGPRGADSCQRMLDSITGAVRKVK